MNAPDGVSHPPDGGRDEARSSSPNLAWVFGLQRFGIRTGLDTVRELLRRLGSPQSKMDTVLVGGTNGKGSVARLLAASLQAAGVSTGLFTSPHLQYVGERAVVNGVPATEAEMESLAAAVRADAEELEATFFEVMTAMSLLRFARARADVAVLEVGMGGRLDATNAVDPRLCIITNVALDHTAILGASEAEIAAEKAGIMRPGVPLLTGATGAALSVVEERAREMVAPLFSLGRQLQVVDRVDQHGVAGWDGLGLELSWQAVHEPLAPPVLRQPGTLALTSPLVGPHQKDNIALAAFGALLLGVEGGAVQEAVAATRWPGRLDRRSYRGRHVVLDGAHNQAAAAALATALARLEGQAAVMILGISADKDVRAVLSELTGLARHVIFTAAVRSPRSATGGDLQEVWRGLGEVPEAEVVEGPAAALRRALELTEPGETVVVAGSLFLVAEASDLLDGRTGEPYERWQ